jgi:sulfatase maturation enzyme AslB (radical SAM superfamily)
LAKGKSKAPAKMNLMSERHMRHLVDFLAEWGVKGVCIGGGGEPLMNRGTWKLPSYIAGKKMESSFVTNGCLIDANIADELMYCRWVGVSIDSGDRETFKRVHGVDEFNKVIANLKLLVKKKKESGSGVDIAYKFLVRPDNINSILPACVLAKEIGVRDFHARPVDLERKDFRPAIKLNYDIRKILDIFDGCHKFENENFRVFTVTHKYGHDFRVKHYFNKCVSAPLMIQCCADGFVYACADHRIEKRFRLGSHYPDPRNILKLWGSDKHKRLLNSIDVDKECGRCTLGEYARQIEEVVLKDEMCLSFP